METCTGTTNKQQQQQQQQNLIPSLLTELQG
jgi:hypothetical protein